MTFLLLVSCNSIQEPISIHIPYLDTNILEGQEYIPYEETEREFE